MNITILVSAGGTMKWSKSSRSNPLKRMIGKVFGI